MALTLFTAALFGGKAHARPWAEQCRNLNARQTVVCAAKALHPVGGVSQALGVWNCESGWLHGEPPHSDAYHGPFQYLKSTFHEQLSSMPAVRAQWDLTPRVHNVRANIVTAVAWGRRSWSPWGCA